MNLSFKTVKSEGDYDLQRAVVTNNKNFWYNWRNRVVKSELKKYFTLRNELLSGEQHWCLYRLFPKNKNVPHGTFSSEYVLHSVNGLLPYQPPIVIHHCATLLKYGASCDGSDTGIGKTYTTLATARELHLRPAIVCKKAGITAWKRGCLHFGINPLFIVNWEMAKNGKFPYALRKMDEFTGKFKYFWKLPEKTILFFDEVHMASQTGTQNNALYVASAGYTSISISATFADRIDRLKGLFHVLNIKDQNNFEAWMQAVAPQFTNVHGETESMDRVSDMLVANRYIYPEHGIRVTYEHPEVKKYFPKAVFQTEIVDLKSADESRQNELYRQTILKVEEYRQLGKNAEAMVAELRYRQVSELLKASVLYDHAMEYLHEGRSVIIFVNYRDTLNLLSKMFKTQSLIFGAQESFKISREKVIDDFQADKTRLIIAMVDAGGASISLHDLHGNHPRISLVCPTYNPITLKQVLGRTYRANSKSTPIIKLFYAGRTIEEKVADSVNQKLSNISALNDGDLMEPDFFNIQKSND